MRGPQTGVEIRDLSVIVTYKNVQRRHNANCHVSKIYKNPVPFKIFDRIKQAFDRSNMAWRDIVTHWLSDKFLRQDGNLATLDLMKLLIEKNMIPATLVDNPTLHSIMLTQIILETLTGVTVPRAPQGNNFTYHMNGKEILMWDLARKNEKQVKTLEEETGVNLDHYHKLNIRN